MNTTKKIGLGLLAVLAVVVIVLGVNYFSSDTQGLSGAGPGPNHTSAENFLQGLFIGGRYATQISTFSCNTATWNPASVATGSQQTVGMATIGVALGDIEYASLATSTQGLSIEANASSTGTSTVILSNNSAAAVDIATTTVKICYLH